MISERIFRSDNNEPMYRKPEAKVLAQETISQEEIRHMAGRFAREIQKRIAEEKLMMPRPSDVETSAASVILDLFDTSTLYGVLREEIARTDEPISLDREEVVDALKPIRTGILRELKKSFPEIDWYDIGEKMDTKTNNKFFHLSEKHVVKEVPGFLNIETQHALDNLYAIKERSPFIAYHHRKRDPETRLEILKEIPIDTIKKRIEKREKDRPPFEEVMQQFLDNVRGLEFLIKNGFALSDLSIDNLGINTETGRGNLFDLDGILKQEDVYSFEYVAKRDHVPPEITENREQAYLNIPKRELQSVYELGISLKKILNTYSATAAKDSDLFLFASLYAQSMTSRDPINRPRVADIVKDLEVLSKKEEEIPMRMAA